MHKVLIHTTSYIVSIGIYSILKEINCNLIIKILSTDDDIREIDYDFLIINNKILSEINLDKINEKAELIVVDSKEENFVEINSKKEIIKKFTKIFCQKKKFKTQNAEISEREREIIKLVALGLTNKEIADRLSLSIYTVTTHRKNISSKLGIKTISGLTIYAILNGIINIDSKKD